MKNPSFSGKNPRARTKAPQPRKRSRQLTMFQALGLRTRDARAHGGGLHAGKRKEMRPLDRRKPIHITMRATPARGKLSLRAFRNFGFVEKTLKAKAEKFGVRVHSYANVGNHLHISARLRSREEFGKFLRSITGLIARHVTGARRGKKFGKFWDTLVYTRVLSSREEELRLGDYIRLNQTEAEHGYLARIELEMDRKYGPAGPPPD